MIFRQARQAGWGITIHAGEAAGAESIWQAIRKLGAARIGHAVHALEDPRLIDFLRDQRLVVAVELNGCPERLDLAELGAALGMGWVMAPTRHLRGALFGNVVLSRYPIRHHVQGRGKDEGVSL